VVKEVLSAIAIGLTFAAFAPYARSIATGRTKPHVFSWVIWGSTTFLVFLAQLEGDAGAGAWPIGVSGTITIGIAILAYVKRGDISITRTDWGFFVAALLSLALWYKLSDPVWAVVVLTTVDVLGFGPTVRKVFAHPRSESLTFFNLFAARNILVVLALEKYSPTTVLFPAVVAAACLGLVGMALYRRRILENRKVTE
jgi:hypothetical protein